MQKKAARLCCAILLMAVAIAASMGTPAIPAAGSVMLYAVLTGAGFNTELCTLIYSLVLAMNKPCEMVLTTLNVVGHRDRLHQREGVRQGDLQQLILCRPVILHL